MAKTPSPLHTQRIPKSVSGPTRTAEAAASVAEAEAAVAPAAKKAKPATPARTTKVAKAVPKTKVATRPSGQREAGPPVAPPLLADKPAKVHKPKLVRDSFTIPKDEYLVLDVLKARALGLETHVRKSELLRAGIQALNAMNDKALLKALGAVPTLKTGRPRAA